LAVWPATWSRSKWSCHTAGAKRSSGPRARRCWLGSAVTRQRSGGSAACRRRCASTTTGIVKGAGAWGVIHPSYRRYATTLCFHVDACPPRQPQCKGKVERRVRDQRSALDPRSRTWSDLEELQRWTDAQLTERSARLICPASGRTVSETFAAERERLTPLPETLPEPFDTVVLRRVGLDALVAFEGRQYSVPSVMS